MNRLAKYMLVIGCIVGSYGCTVVKPWERGELAKAEMAFDTDPMDTQMKEHIYFSKEGSSSGSAVTGGGCGCN